MFFFTLQFVNNKHIHIIRMSLILFQTPITFSASLSEVSLVPSVSWSFSAGHYESTNRRGLIERDFFSAAHGSTLAMEMGVVRATFAALLAVEMRV